MGVFCSERMPARDLALQYDDQTIIARAASLRYNAVLPRTDFCAGRHTDVHALVIVLFAADGMHSVAVVAGDVLKRLHFVAGEVAKRMGLISCYPEFNIAIIKNEKAQLNDVDVDELTKEMYDDYVLSRNRVEKLMDEFKSLCAPFTMIPGRVDLNESIEFKSAPKQQQTITYIQEHFA